MSAEMEIVFTELLLFRRNERGAEKREEIRRWSCSLFQKKVFELRLFAIFKYKNSHGFKKVSILKCSTVVSSADLTD